MRRIGTGSANWLAAFSAAGFSCCSAQAAPSATESRQVAQLHSLATLPGQDLASLRAMAVRAHHVVYPELILNGVRTGENLPVLLGGSHPQLPPARLRELGLALPENLADSEWMFMSDLGVQGRYLASEQRMHLDVPVEWLPASLLQAGSRLPRTTLARSYGALLNYDLFATRQHDGSEHLAAGHEARLFSPAGTLSSSGVFRQIRGTHLIEDDLDYVRLDSFWRYTDPNHMLTYTLGDTLVGALPWSSSARLAGVQISRNFSSRPDLITFPLPVVDGAVSLPTALDIFVNDLKVGEQALQPGPFVLETTPALTGLGEVTLVTTDALGRQVASTVPFYVAPELLRPGLADYSVTLGAPRRQFGLASADYQNILVSSGVARYGLSDHFTVEASASHADELVVGGGGLVSRLGLMGVGAVSYSHSDVAGVTGRQMSTRYDYRRRSLGIGAQYTTRSDGFRDLNSYLYPGAGLKDIAQFNSYLALPGSQGSLSASYLHTRSFAGDQSEFLVMGHSRTLWQRASLNLGVNQNLRDSRDRTFRIGVTLPLDLPWGRRATAGVATTHHPDHTQTVLTLQQPAQQFWDVGWDVAKGLQDGAFSRAGIDWRTPYAQLNAGAFERDSDTTLFAGLTGSLVYASGGLFAANLIGDSFAVVDTAGFGDVPVRQSNQLVGRSNRRGHLLLPNLVAFSPNQISIDVHDLPVDAQVSMSSSAITPADLTGVVVRFDITQRYSAVLTLLDEHGVPMRAGQRVLLPDGQHTVIGYDGEIFVTSATPGRHPLHVLRGDRILCTTLFDLPADSGTLTRLGPYQCPATTPGSATHVSGKTSP